MTLMTDFVPNIGLEQGLKLMYENMLSHNKMA
jgi:hypothetical protein